MSAAPLPMEEVSFPTGWTVRGACRLVPTAVFFPSRSQAAEPAKELCAVCPVLDDCREYALGIADLKGVWGGLTEAERKRLRHRRAAPPDDTLREEASVRRPGCPAKGALYQTLEELATNPGRWARVAWYRGAHTAAAMAARLKDGLVAMPDGDWAFEARADDGGSGLWAMRRRRSLGESSGQTAS